MNLQRTGAVFEFVFLGDRVERQLAFLANRDEGQLQLVREHRAEDEAARVDAGDQADVLLAAVPTVSPDEDVHEHMESLRVLQERRDVAELHALLRPVGHGADALADVGGILLQSA